MYVQSCISRVYERDLFLCLLMFTYISLYVINLFQAYISFPHGAPHAGELPPPDYALYLQFPDDHNLDANLCNIDVSKENLVLSLYKEGSCKGMWDSFEAGSGEDNLEVIFF